MGFGQIIKVAKGLTKKIDPEAKWSIESVGLYKYKLQQLYVLVLPAEYALQ